MAKLYALYGFDIRDLNLNLLISYATDFDFYNNSYYQYNSITYEDTIYFQYNYGGYSAVSFGGTGITFNSNVTAVTGGTVTGVLEEIWTGSYWVPYWGIEKVSTSAVSLSNAAFSFSTNDDFQIISQILSNSDIMELSSYADYVCGYAGGDTIRGNDGNDTLLGDSGNDSLVGGSGGDQLIGDSESDRLDGGGGGDYLVGGTGSDTLIGGGGSDLFRFSSGLGSNNVDTITDFTGSDFIQLENSVFTKLSSAGALKAANFRASTSGNAADGNDYVLYETDTGKLFYDADGSGPGSKVLFATLITIPTVTAGDIFIT